jgi:hypothetical protein
MVGTWNWKAFSAEEAAAVAEGELLAADSIKTK